MKCSVNILVILLTTLILAVITASGQNSDATRDKNTKEAVQQAKSQDAAVSDKKSAASDASKDNGVKPDDSQAKPGTPEPPKLRRWFDLQTATLAIRYAYNETSSGAQTFNRMQHSEIFKAAFKFDKDGKYTLNAGLSSGPRFTLSWNNTGIGTDGGKSTIYLKELFFSAKPVTGLDLQYGGLYISRGESTEITSYDNDGYIVGERVSIKRPKDLFFNEISITYGYLGDIANPNLNRRFYRLKHSNYHQFLVSKNIGKRISLSTDYTFQDGVETMREAVRIKWIKPHVVDAVRFENYQRLDVKPDYGFAASAEKQLFKRLNLTGGFASIDKNYGGLNADRYGSGKRMFFVGSYSLTKDFAITSYVSQAFHNSFPVTNHTWFEVGFSYNLRSALQRANVF